MIDPITTMLVSAVGSAAIFKGAVAGAIALIGRRSRDSISTEPVGLLAESVEAERIGALNAAIILAATALEAQLSAEFPESGSLADAADAAISAKKWAQPDRDLADVVWDLRSRAAHSQPVDPSAYFGGEKISDIVARLVAQLGSQGSAGAP